MTETQALQYLRHAIRYLNNNCAYMADREYFMALAIFKHAQFELGVIV